jgi:uncharacterized membrane protein HdeD (DUF308 family)
MKKNVGNIDRIVRIILAVILGVLYFTNIVTGTLGIVFLIFAIIFLVTGIIKFCLLYAIFGIKTCDKK